MPPFAIPSLEQNRKDDPGIWPECGAASIKALFRRPTESPPNIGLIGRSGVRKVGRFPVDKPSGRSLYTTHRRAVRLRRDCAPLKLLTGTVNRHPIVLGCLSFFDALRAQPGSGDRLIPGLFDK